jgi:hypothetical protein
MAIIFCNGLPLLMLKARPPGARFNQEFFIDEILPRVVNERRQIFRRIQRGAFYVYVKNSMCHDGEIVTDELVIKMLERVPHPVYSSDLSPCDCYLFGMLKQKITDRVFRTPEEILTTIRKIWSEMTLEQLQSVLYNWITRLEYLIAHEREYYAK